MKGKAVDIDKMYGSINADIKGNVTNEAKVANMVKADKQSSKKAIALKYDPENGDAPVITAVGRGLVAEKIMENAIANDVPIYEDEFQANVLSSMDVGSKIPKFLYDLVAEIMVFIEDMDVGRP